MKPHNDPISCNDLIITLVIIALLTLSSFAWLYFRGSSSIESNHQLSLELDSLKQNKNKSINVINTLTTELKELNSMHQSQSIQLNSSIESLNKAQSTIQQTTSTQEKDKQTHLETITSLQNKISEQQKNLVQFKKEKSDVKSQLTFSKQNLVETRMLSEQQFNEFKILKQNFIQTQFEAEKRLKEINEWQLEVKKLKKQLANTKIKMSQPKQRFTVFEMNQEILFNKGASKLKAEGREALSILAKIFQQYPNRKIAIQGHTDSQPLGSKLKKKYNSNWELAAARAASAIYYLQHSQSIAPKRIILVSYAHYRPKNLGKNQKDLASNRRIEITLMPKNFEFIQGAVKIL